MALEISKTFVVKTSPAAAWAFLTDPQRVVRCLPGAALTGQVGEQTYAGTITVKVGPVTATYKGTLRFERLDAATWTAEMVGSGQDVRGKGGADIRMSSRLVERAPGETEVSVISEVNVMGLLAQFGRGLIQDVSDQLFQTFANAARAELEAASGAPGPAVGPSSTAAAGAATAVEPAGAPPIDALTLGSTAVARAAGRAARRPLVWTVGLLVLLIILWALRR